MLEHVRPDGPDRTVIEHLFLHGSEDPRLEAVIHHSEQILEEDALMSGLVQQNVDAGIFESGVLSPETDALVAWFKQRIIHALKGEAR